MRASKVLNEEKQQLTGFKDIEWGKLSIFGFRWFRRSNSYWVSKILNKDNHQLLSFLDLEHKPPRVIGFRTSSTKKPPINFLNRSEAINITATALVKNAFNQFLSLWKQIYGLCKIHLTHTEQKKKKARESEIVILWTTSLYATYCSHFQFKTPKISEVKASKDRL